MIPELIASSGEAPDQDTITRIMDVFGRRFDIPPDYRVTIVCVNENEICHYNKEFFDRDEVTDVISVNMDEQFEEGYLWGEIYVSTETAQKESEKRGALWEEEAYFYIVHGLLHLAGFEDTTDDELQKMWDIQIDLLEQCGMSRKSFVEE
ncbi:rRNA maturation RNase YbeY [Planctomycetota bacterium]